MATPKGKISKSRGRMRRANWKLSMPGITKCPKCGAIILSHRVCKNCGTYAGKEYISKESAAKEA